MKRTMRSPPWGWWWGRWGRWEWGAWGWRRCEWWDEARAKAQTRGRTFIGKRGDALRLYRKRERSQVRTGKKSNERKAPPQKVTCNVSNGWLYCEWPCENHNILLKQKLKKKEHKEERYHSAQIKWAIIQKEFFLSSRTRKTKIMTPFKAPGNFLQIESNRRSVALFV